MENNLPYELTKISSIDHTNIKNFKEKYHENLLSGVPTFIETQPSDICRNCGKCCEDLIPISDEDIIRVKDYVQRNGIKPYRESRPKSTFSFKFFNKKITDVQCPLRHPQKGCMIYPVRPLICKTYLCTSDFALSIRDAMHSSGEYINRSMEESIFGNEIRKKER